ncbi:unnamed protein product, partial [Vitis vinifera]|uniref:Uncharacterized protein n=1 Tax=Vitis vinifera TaxID=29760 RepID=D7T1Z9_VITVI
MSFAQTKNLDVYIIWKPHSASLCPQPTQTFLIIIVHSRSYQEFQVRKKKIINTAKRTSTTCGSRGTKLGKLRSKPCPINYWEILFGNQIKEAIMCGFCSVKSERNLIIL